MKNINLLVHQLKQRLANGESVTKEDLLLAQEQASNTGSIEDRALFSKVKMLLQAQLDVGKTEKEPEEVQIITAKQVEEARNRVRVTGKISDRVEFSKLNTLYKRQQEEQAKE